MHFITGATYEGEWVSDLQEGYGVERWPEGMEYAGEYRQGQKHGHGKLTTINPQYKEPQVFEGEFVNNTIQGKGKYTYHKSSKRKEYEGEWLNNLPHG
jgi:hypothetical protein